MNRHAQLKRRDPRSVPAMASSASQPPRDMEPAGPTPPSFAACTNDGGTGYVIHDHAGQACSAYDTGRYIHGQQMIPRINMLG